MTAMLAAAVLVELFTSEGCSSCPPADAALARLHREQPVPGVELIVLSEHVDYWDDLGWKDPFSDRRFSDRQSAYGGRTYTPQAIVDGRIDVLGSDQAGIVRAAASSARDPHGTLALARTPAGVRISVTGLSGHSDASVMVAVVEDGLSSKVERGENAGRTLSHTAVVRTLREVGAVPAGAVQWSAEVPISLDVSWKQARVIAFVQEGRSRRILAAGALQERRDGAAADRDQRGGDDQAHGAKHAHAP
ncbi:MAG: DUF1223 domain-containing protein [Myxococcales bacterium]